MIYSFLSLNFMIQCLHFYMFILPKYVIYNRLSTGIHKQRSPFVVMFEVNGRVIAVRLREHKEKADYDH